MFTEAGVDFENAKVVILPVPYDGTSTGRSGARYGPRAILQASQLLELWDLELKFEPSKIGIHTLQELQPAAGGPEDMINSVYSTVKDLLNQDKFPVIIGGEHSVSIGAVRALKEKYKDISVLVLDAHADLRDEYEGSKYSHACTARRVSELTKTTILGVRSMAKEEAEYIKRPQTTDYRPQISEALDTSVFSELSKDIYLSIDLDVLDPGIMPAVGTPEPGGFSWQEIMEFIKKLTQSKRVVGFDVVELCPIQGNDAPNYTAAKLIYKTLGYIYYEKNFGSG